MKITSLVDQLVREAERDRAPALTIGRRLAAMATIATIGALALALLGPGPRPDLGAAVVAVPFWLKTAAAAILAAGAARWTTRLARPELGSSGGWAVLPGVMLLTGLGLVMPEGGLAAVVATATDGTGPTCVVLICGFSLLPLTMVMFAMRRGASTRPAAAGLSVGLLAAGLGTLVYGLVCPFDAPVFLGFWYPFGIAVVATAGLTLGRACLRW